MTEPQENEATNENAPAEPIAEAPAAAAPRDDLAIPAAAPPLGPPIEGGGAVEWLWRGRALAKARAKVSAIVDPTADAHARAALELGVRALDPAEPMPDRGAKHLAIDLFRQSLFWLTVAVTHERPGERTARVILGADRLARAGVDGTRWERAWETLETGTFESDAALEPALAAEIAETSRDLVEALFVFADDPSREVSRVLLARWSRLVTIALVVIALVVVASVAVKKAGQGKNLAAGKPWKTSSTYPTCNFDAHECNGSPTNVFFHTNEEDNPWWEVNLGAPTQFAHIEIENRSDCCTERVVPLVVEVSDDEKSWREIGRKKDVFSTWTLNAPARATYVRLRVAKRSFLHLGSVVIR